MELKALKLYIINQVLETQDSEVLQTVAHLLSSTQVPTELVEPFELDAAIAASNNTPVTEERTRDLQKSIDELFNP
jgi:hypothetical protein